MKRFCLTPYRKPASDIPENEVFNFYFSSAWTKIEHVNGILKNRFKSLGGICNQMKNQASFVSANEQVLVCLILHNFLLRINDVWANSENDDEDNDDDIKLNAAAEVETEFVPRNVDEETPQQKQGRIQNSLIEWIHRRNEEIDINF